MVNMKTNPFIILFACTILFAASCKKHSNSPAENPTITRTVKFTLYTDQDFSTTNENITFRLSMQNSLNQSIWDSVLPPMKVKDIPSLAHKLVFQKAVPGNNSGLLKVGFYYSIENVGDSWYFDSSNAGDSFKEVIYDFR